LTNILVTNLINQNITITFLILHEPYVSSYVSVSIRLIKSVRPGQAARARTRLLSHPIYG